MRALLLILFITFSACGGGGVDLPLIGGGGGGDAEDGNPAQVRLKAGPSVIDSGDFVRVEIRITDVTEPFILKIKHNTDLGYVPNSMILQGDGNPGPNIPTPTGFSTYEEIEEEEGSEDNSDAEEVERVEERFLVVPFYSVSHFGEHGRGTLTFRFQGLDAHDDMIQIDADEFLAYPNSDISFDPNNPQFSTLDEERIRVRQDY